MLAAVQESGHQLVGHVNEDKDMGRDSIFVWLLW